LHKIWLLLLYIMGCVGAKNRFLNTRVILSSSNKGPSTYSSSSSVISRSFASYYEKTILDERLQKFIQKEDSFRLPAIAEVSYSLEASCLNLSKKESIKEY
jgi:hypothetical protein